MAAGRPEDITKGRQRLSGVRNNDLYNTTGSVDLSRDTTPVPDDLFENFKRFAEQSDWNTRSRRIGYSGTYSENFITPQNMPMGSEAEDFGTSRFDRGIVNNPTAADIADLRADRQTAVGQFINGISKGAILAGTTFLDGTLGLAFGLVDAAQSAASGDKDWYAKIWDNSVSNGLQKINELSEEALPNYRSTEEMNRPWTSNIFTANFIADTFLKNLGFTVGALYAGRGFNALLKPSGLGAMITGGLYSAINEARIEANNNSDDWEKLQMQQVDDQFGAEVQKLAMTARSQEEYEEGLDRLNQQRNAALSQVEDQKNNVGAVDLIANIPLLTLTDILSWGRIYAKGFESAKDVAARSGKQVTKEARQKGIQNAILNEQGNTIVDRITKIGNKYGWNDIKKATVIRQGLQRAVREGNEELAQAMAAEFAGQLYLPDSPESYYRATTDGVAKKTTDDMFDKLITSFVNTYGDGNRYEEFAVGFLTGLLGTPTFGNNVNADSSTYLGRNRAVGISGGIFGDLAQRKTMNAQGSAAVASMNEFIDKFEEKKIPFMRRTSFSNAMDGFLAEDNKFEYKNAEDNDMFEQISQYARMGKIQDLKDMVEYAFNNLSDTELETIASGVTPPDAPLTQMNADRYYRDESGKLLSETPEGREKMRAMLAERGKKFSEDISMYEEAFNTVRTLGNNAVDDNVATELAWLNWKTKKFEQRFKEMRSESSGELDMLDKIVNQIKSSEALQIKANNELLEKLGDSDADKKKKDELKTLNSSLETYAKDYDNVLSLLEDLRGAEDVNDFSRRIQLRGDKFAKEVFPSLMNLDKDDNFATLPGYDALTESISDMFLIQASNLQFSKTFKEYSEDPAKFRKMHGKIDEERSVENKQREKKEKKTEINEKSVKDLSDLSADELEDLLSSTAEGTGANSKVREAQEFKEYKDAYDKEIQKAVESNDLEGVTEEDIAFVQQQVAKIKEEADSLQEFVDSVGNISLEDIGVSQEEIDDFLNSATSPTNDAAEAVRIIREEKAENLNRLMDEAVKRVAAKKRERESYTPSDKTSKSRDAELTREQKNLVDGLAKEMVKKASAAGPIGANTDALVGEAKDLLLTAYELKRDSEKSNTSVIAQLRKDDTYKLFSDAGISPESYIERLFKSDIMFPDNKGGNEQGPIEEQQEIRPKSASDTQQEPEKLNTVDATSQFSGVSGYTGGFVSSTNEYGYDSDTKRYEVKSNGELRHFYETAKAQELYSEEQIAEMKARHDYLEQAGAFAYRYQRGFAPGTKVRFEIRPDAPNNMILMVTKLGQVVGDMPPVWSRGSEQNRQWVETQTKAYEEWVKDHPNETYVITVNGKVLEAEVAETWTGTAPYTNSPLPLSQVFGDSTPIMAAVVKITKDDDGQSYVEVGQEKLAVGNPHNIPLGSPVILLPSGSTVKKGGMQKVLYYVVPVTNTGGPYPDSVRFRAENAAGARVVLEAAKERFEEGLKATKKKEGGITSDDFYSLKRFLEDFFSVSKGSKVSVTLEPEKEAEKGPIKSGKNTRRLQITLNGNTILKSVHDDDFVDYIIEELANAGNYVRFDSKKANTNVRYFGREFNYNRLIMPVFKVNLPEGTTRTVDASFRLKEFNLSKTAARTEEQKQQVKENQRKAVEKPESIPEVPQPETLSNDELIERISGKLSPIEKKAFEKTFIPVLSKDELDKFSQDIDSLKKLINKAKHSKGDGLRKQIDDALEGIDRMLNKEAQETVSPAPAEIKEIGAEELARTNWKDLPSSVKEYVLAQQSDADKQWDYLDYSSKLELLKC